MHLADSIGQWMPRDALGWTLRIRPDTTCGIS